MIKKHRILLVEDSEAHKELIYRTLEDSGLPICIEWAESLTMAKKMIDENLPNIVLSDWRLNDGNGMELLEYSKNEYPLIIMTSFGNEEMAVSSMKAGVMDYIVKSRETFDKLPSTILRCLREWENIIARKLAEKKLEELAYKDLLTGLPNRSKLYDRLTDLSNNNKAGTTSGVYCLDIDNFNIINDLYGHSFGDRFINAIANTLLTYSEADWFLSRSGGDEFTIIVYNMDKEKEVNYYAEKIMTCINKNVSILGQNIDITCSIGICLCPDNGSTADEILKNLDMALYRAKQDGKNRFVYFNTKMNEEIIQKMEFEKRLREAINKNEFVLYYQPQFDLLTNEFYGFEALIRWNNPIYGMVPPLAFISVAEKTGLIVPIGLWVLKNALIFAKTLADSGIRDIVMSINVSAVQLLQADFVENFINCIKEYKAENTILGIEITESSVIENFETNIEKLEELKKLGLIISLDDFGTGYSSLNYLNRLPIDVVKLDKSFIDGIISEDKNYNLTLLIISMAHAMGLKVVAEGVELLKQHDILKDNSCDIVQGYLLGKPMPELEAFNYIIKTHKRR